MGYKVLIDVKNQWWSDQKVLPTYVMARRHQAVVAHRWNDCATVISQGDRLLNYRESEQFEAELRAIRLESRLDATLAAVATAMKEG